MPYSAPQQPYASPAAPYQAPPATPNYGDVSSGQRRSRGTGSRILLAVLVVLLLGAGILAGVTTSSLNSTRSDLHQNQQTLAAVRADLDASKKSLADAQSQLNDNRATVTNQAAQISSFKACISDLNNVTAMLRTATSATPELLAAGIAARKDCIPLGLVP